MIMKTSKHGITLIEQREGIRLTGYKDSKGLPTIGVGHLIKSGEPYRVGGKITQDECDRLLAEDLKVSENAVNGAVKVPLSQNQFDALVSFTVNIGTGGFKGSTVVKRLNAKDYHGAAEGMMRWVKPPEITGRRRTEQKQFLTPDKAPVVPVDVETPQAPTQIADTIVNTADVSNVPAPEDKVMEAPAKDGATASSTKMTILGIGVPPVLYTIFKGIGDLATNGYINAKELGSTVLDLLKANYKYIFLLIGLIIVVLIVKKVVKQITFWIQMISHMVPSFNNINVVENKENK